MLYLKQNIFDYLYNDFTYNPDFGNYICIKNAAYKLREESLDELLVFVYHGNDAFISLNHFTDVQKEAFQIETENLNKDIFHKDQLKSLSGTLTLSNESFEKQSFTFDRNIRKHYFTSFNDNTEVLGKIEIDGEFQPNFIKIHHGEGAIYLHTNPVVFTNYYLLTDKRQYTEQLLSYLPTKEIIWDPQIKSSSSRDESDDGESIFKFFLQYDTLTWFLYTSFFSLLLFMLFNARRKQRAIPIIEPLKNSTVEFTQTIASLYLKEKNHKNIADKKIIYFLEKVRSKYLIDTSKLDDEFIKRLALKSGNKLENTRYVIRTIIAMQKNEECSEEQLITLNRMIHNFLQNK